MDIVSLLIQLASGAAGGNITGALLKNLSLGTLGNSLAGIIGGGLGGQILAALLHTSPAAGGLDLVSILTQIASGGVGGGGLMAVIGILKSLTSK